MGLLKQTNEDHGSDLLAEYHEFLAAHAERADQRKSVVQSRLAVLEAEHADLEKLQAHLSK